MTSIQQTENTMAKNILLHTPDKFNVTHYLKLLSIKIASNKNKIIQTIPIDVVHLFRLAPIERSSRYCLY